MGTDARGKTREREREHERERAWGGDRDRPTLSSVHGAGAGAGYLTGIDSLHAACPCNARYASRPLFIAGESYAGIYVPMLAQRIVWHNEALDAALARDAAALPDASNGVQDGGGQKIVLEGMLVGNGAIATGDWYEGWLTELRMENAHNKGLLPPRLYAEIKSTCTNYTKGVISPACQALIAAIPNATGPLNAYDLRETCIGPQGKTDSISRDAQDSLTSATKAHSMTEHRATAVEDPCALGAPEAIAYLNMPSVQQAIHVTASKPHGAKGPAGQWSDCGSSFGRPVSYTRVVQQITNDNMAPLFQRFNVAPKSEFGM